MALPPIATSFDLTFDPRAAVAVADVPVKELTEDQVWNRFAQGQIDRLLNFFRVMNLGVLGLVCAVFVFERVLSVGEHVITTGVIEALVAGTVAQLGFLALGLGRTLGERMAPPPNRSAARTAPP